MIEIFYGKTPEYVTNWVRKTMPKYDRLYFVAKQANSTICLQNVEGTYKTSTDGVNWTNYTLGSTLTLPNIGDRVYFAARNANSSCSSSYAGNRFTMSGSFDAFGNIQSLLDFSLQRMDLPKYAYAYLFSNCSQLNSAPDLPVKILSYSGYPQPYSVSSDGCYMHMFQNCSALSNAPTLPATSLAEQCYDNMFSGCTSLQTAPQLIATSLAEKCYSNMFYGCQQFSDCHMKSSMRQVYNASVHGNTTKNVVFDL